MQAMTGSGIGGLFIVKQECIPRFPSGISSMGENTPLLLILPLS
jgi:hypothetical protein